MHMQRSKDDIACLPLLHVVYLHIVYLIPLRWGLSELEAYGSDQAGWPVDDWDLPMSAPSLELQVCIYMPSLVT